MEAGVCDVCRFSSIPAVPRDFDDDVADFHGKFGHPCPTTGRGGVLPDRNVLAFRVKLIREECRELCEAIEARDLARIAAEGVDLLYVTLGTFVICGLRVRPFFNLVHRANMAKVPNPSGGKPLKPDGWEKPDTASLIDSSQVVDLDLPATLRARSGDEWPMDRFCDSDE